MRYDNNNCDRDHEEIMVPNHVAYLDHAIRGASVVLAIDSVIVPFISSAITGEPKTLHEYVGLPPEMDNSKLIAERAVWGCTLLYNVFRKQIWSCFYDSQKDYLKR